MKCVIDPEVGGLILAFETTAERHRLGRQLLNCDDLAFALVPTRVPSDDEVRQTLDSLNERIIDGEE
jgi:hypothetical protein